MKNNNKYDVQLIFLKDEIEDSNIYKMARNGQLENLKIGNKEFKFYNIWIQTLLLWNLVPKVNDNLKEININSKHYSNCYANGYMKGQQYFIDKYENDPRETKETIVQNIMNLNVEVNKVLTVNQYVLNDKVFEDYGYNSGIRFEILRFEKEKKAFFDEVLNFSNNYNKNYFDLVINGIVYNSNSLKAYFIRHQKFAFKNEFIELKDFFTACKEIIIELKKEVEFQYYSGINDLCLKQDKLEAEPSKENLKILESLKPFEKHTKSKNKIFNIKNLGNGKFAANLSMNNILHLEDSIIDAQKSIKNGNNKKSGNENDKPFVFTNNFDHVTEKGVYDYFALHLVKSKHLTKKGLEEYLILAFQNKKLPKQKISLLNKNTNKEIIKIFYNYFNIQAGHPYGKQFDYVKLLGNYFMGFDSDKLKTNFSKIY